MSFVDVAREEIETTVCMLGCVSVVELYAVIGGVVEPAEYAEVVATLVRDGRVTEQGGWLVWCEMEAA